MKKLIAAVALTAITIAAPAFAGEAFTL